MTQPSFVFTSSQDGRRLGLDSSEDLTFETGSTPEQHFELQPAQRCNPYHEVTTNVEGDRSVLRGDVNSPVRGWIDAHSHVTSFMAMASVVFHGKPIDERGPNYSLGDSTWTHGQDSYNDLVGRVLTGDFDPRNTEGWPNFPDWPTNTQLTYSLYHYRWLELAYLSGQRLMVTHLVENEVLCHAANTLNIYKPPLDRTLCDPRQSIKNQARYMWDLQDSIDEQFGGPGQGFFRIFTSPEEARQVIAQGKLAVVMGVEVSELFNCGLNDIWEFAFQGTPLSDADFACDWNDVDQELDALYDLVVRSLFRIHRFDSKFGGTALETGIFAYGNALSSGHLFKTEACDVNTKGAELSGPPIFGEGASRLLKLAFEKIGIGTDIDLLDYDGDIDHCNMRGLSPLGAYLINRMTDKKMLIEVDHASAKAFIDILDIASERDYSGLVSSHSWTHVQPGDASLHPSMERMLRMGGFAAPYHANVTKSYEVHGKRSFYIDKGISRYLDVVKDTPFVQGVGIGSDISGLGGQPGPRDTVSVDPLQYPSVSELGLKFHRQQTGNRVFDLNVDGMAHYGLMADNLEDIRQRGDSGTYEAIMNSAEAYLQMWERATANSDETYAPVAEPFFKIVNRQTGQCFDVDNHDLNVKADVTLQTYDCDEASFDQDWIYDPLSDQIQSRVDRNICLDNGGPPKKNQEVALERCDDSGRFRWRYEKNRLVNAINPGYGVSLTNQNSPGTLVQRGGNGWLQHWRLTTEADYQRQLNFRDGKRGLCMTLKQNREVNMQHCSGAANQQWIFAPIGSTGFGTLTTQYFGDMLCLEPKRMPIKNGVRIIAKQCADPESNLKQHFLRDGYLFRARLNREQVLDAYGGTNASVGFWKTHGGSNQDWHHSTSLLAPWVGRTGYHNVGNPFLNACGDQKVLVGLFGRVGWAVDAIGPVCVDSVNQNGWTSSPWKGDKIGPDSGFAFEQICAQGQAVTGIEVWRGYSKNKNSLGGFRLICKKFIAPGQPIGPESKGTRVGKSGTEFAGTLRCRDGRKSPVALSGSHRPYLNTLGLVCQ
ncbi:ricin-type beta-trefoil lectin domain protein [Gammaproteobacteria bacterium]|nr:ricin-type beta-trefoil lectin domain protein [Gammaproteobacteria bacterium]